MAGKLWREGRETLYLILKYVAERVGIGQSDGENPV